MKRYHATGDSVIPGDAIVALIPLLNTEPGHIEAALTEAVSATEDLNRFLSDSSGEVVEYFALRFGLSDQPDTWHHERWFWPQAAADPAHLPWIWRYVEQVNAHPDSSPWQDELHPRGIHAIAELALQHPSACRLLGDLLFVWEIGQSQVVRTVLNHLFGQHGLGDATLDLLACRVLADSEGLADQLSDLLYGLELRDQIDLPRFAQHCALRIHDAEVAGFNLHEFAELYAAGEQAIYEHVWAAFRSAGIHAEAPNRPARLRRECLAFERPNLDAHWDDAFAETLIDQLLLDPEQPIAD